MRRQIADDFRAELGYELPATRRVLERVPGDKARWKPHPRSSAFGHLAQLVARMPHMLADIVRGVDLDLAASPPYTYEPTSVLLADFDAHVSELQSVLRNAADDVFALDWSLRAGPDVLQTAPRKDVLRNTVNHLVHHRAQLAVYLRLNDIPVPCMYGPTADERE